MLRLAILLSIIWHAALMFVVLSSVQFTQVDARPLLTAQLVYDEKPSLPVAAPMPDAFAEPEPEPATPDPERGISDADAPPPEPAAAQAPAGAAAAPPEPGVVDISPHKEELSGLVKGPINWEDVNATMSYSKDKGVQLRHGYVFRLGDSEDPVILKKGAEFRSLRALANRVYTEEEYEGHYRITPDWYISVIDGRAAFGGMLFLDDSRHRLWLLDRYGKMIYTYGPGFADKEPVIGSITFLTSKDHTKTVPQPSRLIWDKEHPPAKFGTMVYFRDEELTLERGGATLSASLLAPLEGGPHPAGVLLQGGCLPRRTVAGVARRMAEQGLAVLGVDARGCGDDAKPDVDVLADDAVAWAELLRDTEGIDSARVGYLGRDNGALIASCAAARDADTAFLANVSQERHPVADIAPLSLSCIKAVDAPIHWLFTGADPEAFWRRYLESLRRPDVAAGRPIRTQTLALPPEGADLRERYFLRLVGPAWAERAPAHVPGLAPGP